MVLIVLFLGAISFDLWSGFATRRDYAGAADQAAQAGANALDETLFRSTGERKLDPARAKTLAERQPRRAGPRRRHRRRRRGHRRPGRRRAHGNRRRRACCASSGAATPSSSTSAPSDNLERSPHEAHFRPPRLTRRSRCWLQRWRRRSRHHKRLDQTGRHRHHDRPAVDDVGAGHDNGDHTATVDHVNHHD